MQAEFVCQFGNVGGWKHKSRVVHAQSCGFSAMLTEQRCRVSDTVAGGRLEVAYGPKHDWHRYATAQHVKLCWETQCNSKKRRYNNETKVTWCLEVWSRIDGNNFLQRLPEDSHANKLQQVLVDSWTAPIPIASLSCFEHGKMSIKKE